LLDEFLKANEKAKVGVFGPLITFVNTVLAETWEERGEVVESHSLMDRREVYVAELPDGVCYLTMAIDVQVNRIAYQVIGHGIDEEIWVIEYGEINGSPAKGEVWNAVDELLARKWSYKNGRRIMVLRTGIDSGDGNVTETVYQYCRSRLARGVFAVKGASTEKAPPTARSKKSRERNLIIVGVNGIKSDLLIKLGVQHHGPGYIHFPMDEDGMPVRGIDSRYFDMLTSEKKMLKRDKNGFPKSEWVLASGKFNESWDTLVYAIAIRHTIPTSHETLVKALYRKAMWDLPPLEVVIDNDDSEIMAPKKPVSQPRRKPIDRNAAARERSFAL
jgi:phage terminase large subunit GpA-like protein